MNQLTIKNSDAVEISISTDAIEQKQKVLAESVKIKSVTDDASQQLAIDAVRPIKKLLKDIETSRKEIKAPVNALGKRIDALAEELSADLEKEVKRISPMSDSFQADKELKARKAEEDRQVELRRIETERLKAEAEAQKKAQAAENAKTENARQKAMEEHRQAEAKRLELEAQKKVAITAAPIKVTKAEGSVNVKVPKFCVLNIEQIFKNRPDLCTLEINIAAVNDAMRRGELDVPGLKTWWITEVRTR